MGGFDLSLPAAPYRVRSAGASGGAPSATALSATIAGAGVASLAALTIGAEQAETTALVARMTVAPGATRRGRIDALIAGLKSDGVWAKLDWLALLAAHDAQAARLNWRAAKNLTAVNAPVFTVDRGYAGDGASAYLDFGERPELVGPQSAGGSTTLGVWLNVSAYASGFVMGPTGPGYTIIDTSSGGVRVRITTASFSAYAGAGLYTGNSGGTLIGATQTPYFNGVAGTPGDVGVALNDAGNLTLGRQGGGYSTGRIAAAYTGAGMTAAEMAALHGRLDTYLTAIGGA